MVAGNKTYSYLIIMQTNLDIFCGFFAIVQSHALIDC